MHNYIIITIDKIGSAHSADFGPVVGDAIGWPNELVVDAAAELIHDGDARQHAFFRVVADTNHLAVESQHLCHSKAQQHTAYSKSNGRATFYT